MIKEHITPHRYKNEELKMSVCVDAKNSLSAMWW